MVTYSFPKGYPASFCFQYYTACVYNMPVGTDKKGVCYILLLLHIHYSSFVFKVSI